ncbi:MAG: NAD-dependent epimerase/dehydratase family protein [Phycisphaerales bacterium]|nr:NAD-dependent epimerase/dehydratase family protein [Phycisphaerales bacterium]
MTLSNKNAPYRNHYNNILTLVTGGAGFIGSHLSEALIDLGAKVIVLDDLSGGEQANLDSFAPRAGNKLTFVKGSILDRPLVDKLMRDVRYVFHQAAWGSVPRSVEMPETYHQINITGTVNVLEAARAAKVQRVVFAASSSAYGDTPTLPKVETMPVLPRSPYAATKVACEAMLRAYANCYEIDTACLRYFNIFGPRQNANSAYAAVIAAFAKNLLGGQRPRIFGDGEQSRDFTFVDNAVHANLLAAFSPNKIGGEVMNIACGRRVTVNELATKMAAMLGREDLTAEHLPPRAGDVAHSLAALEKARQLIGYEPVVDFDTGLAATVQWYKQVM